jgi:hypothetical protein
MDAAASNLNGEKKDTRIKPGEVRNPAGRPKGARSKLGEDFLKAMQEDFAANGKVAVISVRETKPDQYLKVIASILPKEIELSGEVVTLTKEQRDAAVAAAARADT